ncbi:unnamed protein product, partial [Mesorhabditis spiculigera]
MADVMHRSICAHQMAQLHRRQKFFILFANYLPLADDVRRSPSHCPTTRLLHAVLRSPCCSPTRPATQTTSAWLRQLQASAAMFDNAVSATAAHHGAPRLPFATTDTWQWIRDATLKLAQGKRHAEQLRRFARLLLPTPDLSGALHHNSLFDNVIIYMVTFHDVHLSIDTAANDLYEPKYEGKEVSLSYGSQTYMLHTPTDEPDNIGIRPSRLRCLLFAVPATTPATQSWRILQRADVHASPPATSRASTATIAPHLHRADLRCATHMRNNNAFTRKNSSLAAPCHCFRTELRFFDITVPKPPLPDVSTPVGRYSHHSPPCTADAQHIFATSSLFGDNVKRISSSAHRVAFNIFFRRTQSNRANVPGFASYISRRSRIPTTSWR